MFVIFRLHLTAGIGSLSLFLALRLSGIKINREETVEGTLVLALIELIFFVATSMGLCFEVLLFSVLPGKKRKVNQKSIAAAALNSFLWSSIHVKRSSEGGPPWVK